MKMRWLIGGRYISSGRPAKVGKEYGADPAFAFDFNMALSEDVDNSIDAAPSASAEACEWLREVIDRLTRFVKLEENWDGYGAGPVKADVVSAAKEFIKETAISCPLLAPVVTPTRNGGVLFAWRHGPHRLDVQFTSRDTASFAYLDTRTDKGERGQIANGHDDAMVRAILRKHFVA